LRYHVEVIILTVVHCFFCLFLCLSVNAVGIPLGVLLIYLVNIARHNCKKCKRSLAILCIITSTLGSYLCAIVGAVYIYDVWLANSGTTSSTSNTTTTEASTDDFEELSTSDAVVSLLVVSTIVGWPIICIIYHICYFCYSQKKKKNNNTHRFNSQVFMQSLNPAGILIGGIWNNKKNSNTISTGDNRLTITTCTSRTHEVSEKEEPEGCYNIPAEEEQSQQIIEDKDRFAIMSSSRKSEGTGIDHAKIEDEDDYNRTELPPKTAVTAPKGTSRVSFITQEDKNNEDVVEVAQSRRFSTVEELSEHYVDGNNDDNGCSNVDCSEEDGPVWDGILSDAESPSYSTLFRAKLYETYPNLFCCFKKAHLKHQPERRMSLGSSFQTTKSCRQRWWNGSIRLFWYVSSLFFFFLTIVNIGSTTQQTTVRTALGPTFAQLYPPDFNTGSMCAWDKASPNATIKTFDTLQAVYDANWTVVHCGACGACSNWNDLSLQWTTRKELAKLSKQCAQKSMFGSWDDVTQCNEDLIGFLTECAECWTYDEINTKNKCFWIFLQSIFIDSVSDFSVGFNDITSATCDEALSGPVFVPCSGATRRRMGIISDIPRPDYQQCKVVEYDWSVVFNHP
jgi:hypothetical protein